MRSDGPQAVGLLRVAADGPLALEDQPVVGATEQRQVGGLGGAAVGPVAQMVGLGAEAQSHPGGLVQGHPVRQVAAAVSVPHRAFR
jgi:hypothetical protein